MFESYKLKFHCLIVPQTLNSTNDGKYFIYMRFYLNIINIISDFSYTVYSNIKKPYDLSDIAR